MDCLEEASAASAARRRSRAEFVYVSSVCCFDAVDADADDADIMAEEEEARDSDA